MNKREYIDDIIKEARIQSENSFKNKCLHTTDILNKLINAVEGLQKELESTQTLLDVVNCPNCDGSGTIVMVVEGYEAGCCGLPHNNGECCGDPVPIETQEQQLKQCQWCYEVDKLKNRI